MKKLIYTGDTGGKKPADSIDRNKRRIITGLGGLAVASALPGQLRAAVCDNLSGTTAVESATAASGTTTTNTGCILIPSETEGPYPLYSVLSNSAMVRRNITEGRTGVPLTLRIALTNVSNNCASLSGALVYVWHCDKDGAYSGYSQPGGNTQGETFCRGIQETDANGVAEFTTIFPGWYRGRITHVHFQVYVNGGTLTATSQLGFPQDVTARIYDSSLYSGQNTSVSSFSADNVFSDGVHNQLVNINGDLANGYTATLNVGVAL